MNVLRQVRKSLTFGALRAGAEFSKRSVGAESIECLRRTLLGLSKVIVPLRARLKTNMQLAGVWRPGLADEHFQRALDQMAMIANIFRAGFDRSGCVERFRYDDTIRYLEQACASGRGALCIGPHLCGYPVFPRVLNERIPCKIYMRRNKDPRKLRMNEGLIRWGRANVVYPPPGATKAQRLHVALDVLRQGHLMFLTPDLPRKPEDGVAVSIFGRRAYFPTGPFVMSLRTGAPVVPAMWFWNGGAYHVRFEEPIELSRGGDLRRKAEAAMQRWALRMDEILHEYPAMWWNWLDKRWSQILRNGSSMNGEPGC
jgi:lauroyl/myristoyl acyltransferase